MRVTLEEIAKSVGYGVTASACEDQVGPKCLRITDIQNGCVNWDSVPYCECAEKKLAVARLQSGDIVFARTGATTGKSFLIDQCPQKAVYASYLIRVRLGDKADPKYVSQFFRTPDYWRQITKSARGVAQPGVNATTLKGLQIPLPPLSEQKRIAKILDTTDTLRTKRREALAQLDTLLQSTFLDMFGDPVANPMGWEVKKSANIFSEKPKIGTIRPAAGKGYLVVRVGELGETQIRFENCNRVELNEKEFDRYVLREGDTVIARAIGSKNQLGKASFFGEYLENVVIDSHVMRLRPNATICNPKWFFTLLSSPQGKLLLQEKGGATAVQFNINAKQASDLDVPLPPLTLQTQFAAIVKSIEQQKARMQAHLAELDTLFAALQQRAFNGDL
ncbi:type I restriction enzyme, S subunit [Candidatus Electrothrix aarhusensis]|uniref:Type I restriction enzyme, S subunit n=1 Tax=Candidatus Electrothrix aarhusensis TaxID=1859131 RepID=A0A3S3RPI4_9BACT|nr:type I restriction enzyme, S subunit [Candidatus Electrothrix aarhusensis]